MYTVDVLAPVLASASIPLATNWADHIKVRMQSAAVSESAKPYLGGLLHTARRLLTEEGLWSLYTTGMSASIMREASSQACRLGMYPAARDIVGKLYGSGKGANSGIAAKLSAGIGLGALSAVVASPFDLVRIRLQAEGGRVAADGKLIQTGLLEGLAPRLHGTAQTFATIVRENGLGALWRGLGVNVLRGALMTAATVPVYDHSKHVCLTSGVCEDGPSLHLGAGLFTGVVAVTISQPADVLRTRMMASTASKPGLALLAHTALSVARGGPLAFLRGWWGSYLRLGPVMVFYPILMEQIRSKVFGLGYFR